MKNVLEYSVIEYYYGYGLLVYCTIFMYNCTVYYEVNYSIWKPLVASD